jgi:hypothetical protein
MYLDVYERDTSRYMQDTCMIHRIRILITNVPKFDNKSTVILVKGGRGLRRTDCITARRRLPLASRSYLYLEKNVSVNCELFEAIEREREL